MSYTNISNVAAMFPTWVRGTAQQKPADATVQIYIDDVAGMIDAVLDRRFATAIGVVTVTAWVATLPADANNILEQINRYGAAAQLSETLATFGVAAAERLGKSFRGSYDQLLSALDARGKDGKPLSSGVFDHLFDSLARTETPRPAMAGTVAGGDQPDTQAPSDLGMSNKFGKFDKRGT